MVHLPTVDCPVCGRETKIGLPRGATVIAVSADPPGDAADGLGRKCREVVCPDGHPFHVSFARGSETTPALESCDDAGAGDTEVGE